MRKLVDWATDSKTSEPRVDAGLLFLRITTGGFIATLHGWGKLTSYGSMLDTFADPIGLGPGLSLTLTVFAEFVCGLAIVVGLATRAAAVPLVIMMLVAAGIVHADDPWSKKEFALLYAIPFVTLIFTGAGRYSLDAKLFRRTGSGGAPAVSEVNL